MALVLIRIHLSLSRLRGDRGQTSAEYALVLIGAASIALLVGIWARDTDRIGKLLDTVVDSIVKLAK